MSTKKCTKCGCEWPATTDYFHRHTKGFQPRCRACRAWTDQAQRQTLEEMTGIEQPRPCTKCKEVKPPESSKYRHDNKKRRHSWCIACSDNYQKDWRQKNKERVRVSTRRNQLKRFGLTPEDYKLILRAQNYGCAICGGVNGQGELHVDHCHDSGTVRGLLCFKCNAAVGLLGDDAELTFKVARYLQS